MWGGAGVSEADRLSRADTTHVLRRTLGQMRRYRRHVATAGALIVVWTVTVLAGPLLVRYGIDQGIRKHHVASLDGAVIAYVVVAVVAYVASQLQIVAVSRAGEGFLRDLRTRVFDHMLSLSMAFFDREKAGVLVGRMTSDIDSMGELIQFGLLQFVSNGLLMVLTALLLLVLSPLLALVCLVSLPMVVVASARFQRQSNRAYLTVRDRIGHNLSTMQEGITGVRVIQAFGREVEQVQRFRRSNKALFDAHMESVRISVWYFPIVEFAGAATTAAVVGVGGVLVHRGSVSLGTVAAFVLLLANLFEPVQQLSQLFNTVQASGASLKKLYALLDTVPEVAERPGAVDLPAVGDIEVSDISFAYAPGLAPVLQHVSLSIANGERIALVGPTGAGKSTLAKLVARLYDPTDGTITYGGVDLRDATLASLRRRIVVVPQEGFLFDGSVRDNVRIARAEASDVEVEQALRDAGVHQRFADLPEGLDTPVQERGARLSAGERQLVSLARAALVNPAVLVLDEATSSLDPGTEALVEQALDRLVQGRTVIVIAHRLTTAARADRIGVVADGCLAEVGTHAELLALGGRYAALYASWIGAQP